MFALFHFHFPKVSAMFDIHLRTHQSLYEENDVIYGAVYVHIKAPTQATGVTISLIGHDKCIFHNLVDLSATGKDDIVIEKKENIFKEEKIMIYKFDEPIPLGSYVFPFQVRVPEGIQGSFCLRGSEGPRWECSLVYQVIASLLGAEILQASQEVLLYPRVLFSESVPQMTSSFKVTFLKVITSTIPVIVSLDRNQYMMGDTVKVNIDMQIPPAMTITVTNIAIKLKRDLVLHLSRHGEHSGEHDEHCVRMGRCSVWHKFDISPQDAQTIWSTQLPLHTKVNLQGGLQNLLVPLKSDSARIQMTSSANNSLYECRYYIEVELSVERAQTIHFKLPIPSIRSGYNKEFEEWAPPAWLSSCKPMYSSEFLASPSWNVIETGVYEKLPGLKQRSRTVEGDGR